MKIYEANYNIVKQTENKKTGANVHHVNSLLNLYHVRIKQYNRGSINIKEVEEIENKLIEFIKKDQ